MFSRRRDLPQSKKDVVSRLQQQTTSGPSSPSASSTSSATSNGNGTTTSKNVSKPVVKVSTITRTIKVETKKKVMTVPRPPLPSPSSVVRPPLPSKQSSNTPSSSLKRKASGSPHPSTNGTSSPKPHRKLSRSVSIVTSTSSESESESTGTSRNGNGKRRKEEDSSSDDDTAGINFSAFSKRESSTVVVERSVSALSSFDPATDGKGLISGFQLVMDQRNKYKSYFVDPSNVESEEWKKGSEDPVIELEYPAVGAKEKFVLLEPKNSDDEYDPIEDIISTIRITLDHFLTSSQSSLYFSHTPSSSTSFSAFLSAPTSRSSTPTLTNSDSPIATTAPIVHDPLIPLVPPPPFMRSLEKAKLKKDGPAFFSLIESYNATIKGLKERGELKKNIEAMKGLKSTIWQKVVDQVYERSVGPQIHVLKNYEAFSDNVYGELLPRFMGEIFEKTGLGPNSVFVDLGSGVGNCVLQAALATGCEAWGFENMENAAQLASSQVIEAEKRFKMWGISHGKMKTIQADFCESPEVGKVLKRADVVLVNNEVFTASLNQRLSLLFLDLPSSTRIVSLKAFASSFTLSSHNRDSPLAILDQGKELRYGRKSVSWKDEGGTYFIGRIDRTKLEKFERREERRRENEVERRKREEDEGRAV